MIEQNEINASNQEEYTTHLEKLKTQLANELANDDLQVYIDDNEAKGVLINGLIKLISQVYLQVWEQSETD